MVELPYGLQNGHIMLAMNDFLGFLGFVNEQLNTRQISRLESILMPANFSSIVGEFIKMNIPGYCQTLAINGSRKEIKFPLTRCRPPSGERG